MSKAEYSYPEDEFDVPSNPDVPRGVHRAPRSAWSRWWKFLVVLALLPVLAFALVNLAARDGNLPSLPGTSTAPEAQDDTPTDAATEGEVPTDTETAPVDEPVAPAPVLSTPVEVLNAASIGGLAAEQAAELTAAGFTAVTTGNAEPTVDASTVSYTSEDLRPTADLVAQTLGLTEVVLQAGDNAGISVLLVSDPDA
ncbi:LytR C-terminal domain-containing protein [Cellulomonas sp. Leaf395]|uniref:LytR C-terminal domain-containing protein n=1 Tax=Cellulomonas sp. Leaf395 TaxID=1736362 RepID=UPI0006FFA157|nr:LytR C-terminal domain-containing protein [Cellulomonas sp. Leaf395]KQT02215.1 hypothetical protein ASG23_02390 [Cellulomonas sp. Leaf395]